MTTYNEVFDEKQYRSVNKKAAKIYVDQAVSSVLPLITTEIWDAYAEALLQHGRFKESKSARARADFLQTSSK